jgi:hypothetical protein
MKAVKVTEYPGCTVQIMLQNYFCRGKNLYFSWWDVCDEWGAGTVHNHVTQVVQQLTSPVLFNIRATIHHHRSGLQGNFFNEQ